MEGIACDDAKEKKGVGKSDWEQNRRHIILTHLQHSLCDDCTRLALGSAVHFLHFRVKQWCHFHVVYVAVSVRGMLADEDRVLLL